VQDRQQRPGEISELGERRVDDRRWEDIRIHACLSPEMYRSASDGEGLVVCTSCTALRDRACRRRA
jgi:hypothetical protein